MSDDGLDWGSIFGGLGGDLTDNLMTAGANTAGDAGSSGGSWLNNLLGVAKTGLGIYGALSGPNTPAGLQTQQDIQAQIASKNAKDAQTSQRYEDALKTPGRTFGTVTSPNYYQYGSGPETNFFPPPPAPAAATPAAPAATTPNPLSMPQQPQSLTGQAPNPLAGTMYQNWKNGQNPEPQITGSSPGFQDYYKALSSAYTNGTPLPSTSGYAGPNYTPPPVPSQGGQTGQTAAPSNPIQGMQTNLPSSVATLPPANTATPAYNPSSGLSPLAQLLYTAQQSTIPHLAHGGQFGALQGHSGGQADQVNAKLSDGEFVIPADVVSHLGDGNNNNGAGKLNELIKNVRVQKTGHNKFPPKAHGALSYMGSK